jgi:hypothetical protein
MALTDALRSGRSRVPSLGRNPSPGRLAGEIALGAAGLAVGGMALYLLKERTQEEAEHTVIESDGAFSLRRYGRLVTAEVRRSGPLTAAMDKGHRSLADYIGARRGARRAGGDGRSIPMTVPVSLVPGENSGAWTIRFVMPRAWERSRLPEPANGVTLGELPPRTLAAVRFAGRAADRELIVKKRQALLDWVARRGLVTLGEPEFAAYNAPIVPAALRRNEWWVEVRTKNPPV